MTVAHVLQANFTQSLGRPITPPANSKTMVFFGTGGDGNETNRIVGGPALTVSSGSPVHSANFVSLGHQPAGAPVRFDAIDTGVPIDATNFAAGYTWAVVARTAGEGTSYSQAIGDMTAAAGQGQGVDALGFQLSTNRIINGGTMGNRSQIQCNNSIATTWHFAALTCSGGATPSIIAYEFTENQSGQATAPHQPTGRIVPNPQATIYFGGLSVITSSFFGPIDIAFGYVCTGAMSQSALAALAASVRPWLARRGVVM